MKEIKKILIAFCLAILFVPIFALANPDLNNDGEVDINDLIIVAKNFGLTSGFAPEADTDGNDVIDIFDVVFVASRFGTVEPPPTDGNIINAASCSRNDIQAAVDSASIGDVVVLPACNQNGFPGTVIVPANIEIRGQGKTQTVLSRTSLDGTNPMFRFECSDSDRLKFSGLTLDGVGDDSTLERGLLIMDSCEDLRIWDVKFQDLGYYGIFINNYNKGVIWDCDFVHCFATGYGYGVVVEGEKEGDYPAGWRGDWSWSQPLSLGTDEAIFIEDCTASRTKHVVAAARGSRYVFRHNNIIADGPLQYPVDTHGPHVTGGSRGARQIEVYNNYFELKQPQWHAMAFFSGRGAIFDNTIIGTTISNPAIYFGHPCCGANNCGPYPEVDQLTDLYIWGNDYDGGVATDTNTRPTTKCNDEVEQLFVRGRDYFFEARPDYTPYTYPHPLRGAPAENIVNAASLSASDIQDAVDSASPGDVVMLPTGNIQWGSSDVVSVTKSVEIRGMGKDNTILKKNGGDSSRMFRFDCSSNPKVGFSKIKLIGSDGITTSDLGINLFNDCQDFKIHDSHFEGFGYAGIYMIGEPKGVIYNCDFIDNFMDGLGYGVAVIGKNEWPTPLYGSDNWLFIENCYFEGHRHAIASGEGGRYVFRHNTVKSTYTTNHAVDAHGQRNINQRGTRAFEIYENLIDEIENPGVPHGIGLRGGDGVVFNNDIRNVNMPIYFKGEPPSRFGGSCDWTTDDYPAFDQSQDVYFWGNTDDSQAITSIDKASYCGYDLLYEEGRDYYMYQRPGYTPYPYPHPLRNT